MKLLVTGASGFIGSRLSLYAREHGIEVKATGGLRNAHERMRAAELRTAGIDLVEGNLLDPDFVRSLAQDCDVVIHLAAAQHESAASESYYVSVNVDATRSLLEACYAAGTRRFIYGSTIGVYGDANGRTLDETTAPSPVNYYGRSKLAAEEVVNGFADRLETTIVRISETYGPGDFRLLKLFRAIEQKRFVMIGDGANIRQTIYIEDLIRGLLAIGSHPNARGELFVFAGSEVLTTNEAVRVIAEVLGCPMPRLRVPMWPFLLLATGMELTFKPLGLAPPLHRRRLDFFRKSFAFSTAKQKKILGFEPATTFRAGAAKTAAWYRQNGYLRPSSDLADSAVRAPTLTANPPPSRGSRTRTG